MTGKSKLYIQINLARTQRKRIFPCSHDFRVIYFVCETAVRATFACFIVFRCKLYSNKLILTIIEQKDAFPFHIVC